MQANVSRYRLETFSRKIYWPFTNEKVQIIPRNVTKHDNLNLPLMVITNNKPNLRSSIIQSIGLNEKKRVIEGEKEM